MIVKAIKAIPQSWSALTWKQLCDVWSVKQRFGGNSDVVAAAALLALCRLKVVNHATADPVTGEDRYVLRSEDDGRRYVCTPRLLVYLANHCLPWLQYPYGDPGKEAVKDDNGKVIEESVDGHQGYVNPIGEWRDAMSVEEEVITVCNGRLMAESEWLAMSEKQRYEVIRSQWADSDDREIRRLLRDNWEHTNENQRKQVLHSPLFTHHFLLPQVAMNNLTWHQYRSLQGLAAQLFKEDLSDKQALELQAEFVAYCVVPEDVADSTSPAVRSTQADPFRPSHRFIYRAERAEASVIFWRDYLRQDCAIPLFHICFQVYQTALHFYSQVFFDLFNGTGKSDPLHTALTGESGTLNAVMKYAGYANQQQVYDSNLPFVLDILNTMNKEAKEISKMNAKIKKK